MAPAAGMYAKPSEPELTDLTSGGAAEAHYIIVG